MKVAIFDLDDTLFDCTGQLAGSYNNNLERIMPFEGVHEVLALFGVRKFLVTAGNLPIQLRKTALLGIQHYFEGIDVCPSAAMKEVVFGEFKNRFPASTSSVIAIGNRIDAEIMYGNQCGFTTVLMKHGKYTSLVPVNESQVPNYTISSLQELLPILNGR